ncbi:MAG: TRAM domain-containing protein [Verrucomicrobia bacterium]|nr:TRAM domain-containing protein [Verrucomicrobiota bacterium]
MKISLVFLRAFFVILSLFFMTAFMISLPTGPSWQKILIGLGIGLAFSGGLYCIEMLFRRFNLKAFNTIILGLGIGSFLGLALIAICNTVVDLSHMKTTLAPQTVSLMKVCCYLFGTYLGTLLTVYFADEIPISIPFVKVSTSPTRKKDLVIDSTALYDARILDLASTGLVDNSLIMPRFLVKELYSMAETGDEVNKSKARRTIETLKRLETTSHLGLRFEETEFTDTSEPFNLLLRLARINDANILTADISQAQIPAVEGIKIINLHSLSNALKPLMQAGESMKIKIQRLGKEPNQGVGYLEDGTMVVVNGGGDYIGECIDVQVLSVKHTSSGRMIFCNTMDEFASMKGTKVEG